MSDAAPTAKPKVLCVDDEESILKALKRCLRRAGVDVLITTSGAEALRMLESENIAVLLCDQRMPEMPGSEVLEKSVPISPDTYRITLTGYTDLESAQKTINQGQVHQFLTKPWDDGHLRSVIGVGVESYELKQESQRLQELTQRHLEDLELRVQDRTKALLKSNKELAFVQVEQMVALRATIRILASTLGLVQPGLGLHSQRVADLAVRIAPAIGVSGRELQDLEFAAVLHDFGMISLAGTGEAVTEETKEEAVQAVVALMGRVRGFDQILTALRHQREHFDGTGTPDAFSGEQIPIASRVIAAVNAYDEALSAGGSGKRLRQLAQEVLEDGRGSRFDPAIVDAILATVEKDADQDEEFDTEVELSPHQVETGMVISRDLCLSNDVLLLAVDTKLTLPMIQRIQALAKSELLFSSVFVKATPPTDEELESARRRESELG